MSIAFSGVITPTSIVFCAPSGKMINVSNAHANFQDIKEAVKTLQEAIKKGAPAADLTRLHQALADLCDPAKVIREAGKAAGVEVENGVVYHNGEAIHNTITTRIVWGMAEGFDMNPYIRFLENLMANPSKRSVDELYKFMEASQMGITDDGHIIAYKRVRDDYLDIHSRRFDNSVGSVLEMPRNKVDDDKDRTCSYGFHFCSFSYLPHFGAGPGSRIMIVKVNPADVVSIPADYENAKARTCRYVVIGEYEGSDKEDILGTRSVWAGDEDWQRDLHEADEGSDDEWYASADASEASIADDLEEFDASDDWTASDDDLAGSGGVDALDALEEKVNQLVEFCRAANRTKEVDASSLEGKRVFFQSQAPNLDPNYIWFKSDEGNTPYVCKHDRWIANRDIKYSAADDIAYRVAKGQKINEIVYYYSNRGDFRKAVVFINDGSDIAICSEPEWEGVDAIAQAQSQPIKRRMEIVP